MSIIKEVLKNAELQPFLADSCQENDICVEIDNRIEKENFIIIKVDRYYNSLHEEVPPSPDCLIIQTCDQNKFKISIVELKNIDSSKHLKTENLIKKYETCLNDFISNSFKDILYKDYSVIKLYFISHIEKRDYGLKISTIMNKRFSYKNKKYMIELQTPGFRIKPCYK